MISEVNLCHTAQGVHSHTHTQLVGTVLRNRRKTQHEIIETREHHFIALIIIPASASGRPAIKQIQNIRSTGDIHDVVNISNREFRIFATAVVIRQQFGKHGHHVNAHTFTSQQVTDAVGIQ